LATDDLKQLADTPFGVQRRNNLRGMAFSVASGFVLVSSFGMARHVSAGLHPFEVTFLRSFFGLIFLAPWLFRFGLKSFRTARLSIHIIRSVFHVGASLTFFFALTIAPFAELTALYFISPVFVTIMAVIFFREIVGIRRWAAVLTGFLGMLIILRPGLTVLEFGSILAVISAVFGAGSAVITKELSRTESVVTITSYSMTFMSLLLLIPAAFVWEWPSLSILPWLIMIGVTGGLANYFFTSSLKAVEISVITPFSFLQLIWAAFMGFFFFGEVPEIFVWIGGLLIFAATTFLAIREHAVSKATSKFKPIEF